MLKLENVTKYYGDLKAVDNLSFEVNKGEIFGLLGVNGAGKTTTFRMITNLIDPTSGSITLDGKKIDYDVTDEIGFLTEERSLLLKLTVKEQCIYYGKLKGMDDDKIIERMKYLLDKFEISDYENKKIKELSKGNQQKVQFITAIIHEPKLVILDEPFSGLDPFNVELFKREIVEMANKGSMIIFSSHRMEHVELFCKKLLILLKGKTVLKGDLRKIKEDYRKKNIFIKADIDYDKLNKIKGVEKVLKTQDEVIVTVLESKNVSDVFNYIKTCKNVTKFVVEEPSLNEIFVSKVGEAYEN